MGKSRIVSNLLYCLTNILIPCGIQAWREKDLIDIVFCQRFQSGFRRPGEIERLLDRAWLP